MTKIEALEFCHEWLKAWSGNRPEHLITFYHADAYYRDPARPHGLTGREQLLNYFQRLLAVNPDWSWQALEVFSTDKGLVVKWRATFNLESGPLQEEGMDIVELQDGKITRNEVYFDRTAWFHALKGNV